MGSGSSTPGIVGTYTLDKKLASGVDGPFTDT